MHPWHDIYVDDAIIATAFPTVIEIPKGSKNKYELAGIFGLFGQGPITEPRPAAGALFFPRLQGAREQAGRGRRPLGPAEAIVIISEALELYRKLRRGERK